MKENMEIEQLEKNFHDYKNLFSQLLSEYTGRVTRTIYSRGWYYNIFLFENEINGFQKGRILKKKPNNINNITEYGIDADDKVILIIEHITSLIRNYTFIRYTSSNITLYKYVGGTPHLRNITEVVLSKENTIDALYNWGEYGWRIDTYRYNSLKELRSIHREAKEHQSDQIIKCDIVFNYCDEQLSTIEQHYANGYNKIIYSQKK